MEKKKVVIIGAGGHAKVVLDCIDRREYDIVGFLDKDKQCVGQNISGYPILGDDSEPEKWMELGITRCIIGLGNMGNAEIRNRLYQKYLSAGFEMITAVHSTAVVSETAIIGAGTVVMPSAVINRDACVGENCIINTASVIEHEVSIKDGVHVAPRSVISGNTVVEENTFIGVGSTIINGITIGKNAVVGAGSVVVHDIPGNVVAVGIPAKAIKRRI